MRRIAITGARGFIGRELEQQCIALGHNVSRLARGGTTDKGIVSWQLGDPLPRECEDVDSVVHLASATLVARDSVSKAADLDLLGTRQLIESIRALRKGGKRIRFVFVSSQSANVNAENAYGRSKLAIEALLNHDDEIVIRPGLVYDDNGGSVFSLFKKLSRLPILPILSSRACIQPIHVQEVSKCILQIISIEQPDRLFCLGAIKAMSFREAILATARRAGRRPPLTVRISVRPVRLAARLLDWMLRLSPSLLERIDGLIALQPMETESSLRALNRELAPFDIHTTTH